MILASRRMAATAIAIRLYELDHGRRPSTLVELIGSYLPATPDDPLAPSGPIRYIPNAERPLLYSVGQNGTDDGGAYTMDSTGHAEEMSLDLPFFLDGSRPHEEGRSR
jgi:hypothetical protein